MPIVSRPSLRRRPARLSSLVALALGLCILCSGPARAIEIQRVVSEQGIEAWLVEDHSNPVISMEFVFRGGSAADPEGKEGLANLVSRLLDEGAGDLDSEAFQRRLSEDAISLSFSTGRDSFSGSLRTLSERRGSAVELLGLALADPRFDEESVARVRSQALAAIARSENTPSAVAWRRLQERLFPDHPYGRPAEGTRESIAAIESEDLRSFVETRLARDRLMIGVVGDVTAEELGPLLDAAFGRLPLEAEAPEVPAIEPQAEGAVLVVEWPQSQSQVVFAQSGLKRDDPDYYALNLVNYILGGGSFASRLYEEVRERRGLAYSVYSSLLPMDASALVVGGFATENARVGEAWEVVQEEWRRMAEEGLEEADLERAKTYTLGSFPLNLTSTGNIASILVSMQMNELGIDYLDEREALISEVTLEDARRVAAKLLNPQALSAVVVGQPEGIEASATETRQTPSPAPQPMPPSEPAPEEEELNGEAGGEVDD